MDTPAPIPGPHGDTNVAHIGDGARVDQLALGSNITQIKGYTAEQVGVLLTEISASYQPKPFDGRSPYVGLASFQEQDAARFFGREKLTRDLIARVATLRFLIIAGPSGSGKSSVARAGVIPALKNGALPQSEHWLYEILAPGRHPLTELGRVVASLTKSLSAGDEIPQKGRTDPTLLHRWSEIALGDQRTRRVILLIDQFEESFTQVSDETERAAFFNLLTYLATVENGRVTIVCATRSDFIGNWAAYPNLNAQLAHGVNQIPPMQDDELVSAIARPALQAGLRIDPDLVKQILDDMRDAPGALPLMQFALQDLFEHEKSKGGVIALTRDGYLERGGLRQALARHADGEFLKLGTEEQQIARTVFAALIEPGRGTADTKRTALFQELVPADGDPAQVQKVVSKLADARLVTTDEQDQHETVTLAHERLIDAWAWLRRLVDENREAITLQNAIAADAQEWEQHGREASYLYSGVRLAAAQVQVKDKKITLRAPAREFITAGQRRYRMIRVGIVTSVLLGTGILAAIATLGITRNLNAWFFPPLPMEWVDIPAGEFPMGSTAADLVALRALWKDSPFEDERAYHPVYLGAFQINRFEVTNREYRQCENALICDPPSRAQIPPQNGEKYPVTNVSWTNAKKFCERSGGRLPTEAEWEKAARGTLANHDGGPVYPWGYVWDPSLANAGHGPDGETMPVGSFPGGKSPYGVEDMAGNVYEWVADWYKSDYYAESPLENPTGPDLSDKAGFTTRVYRGGSYADGPMDLRVTARADYLPSDSDPQIGFRCARETPG